MVGCSLNSCMGKRFFSSSVCPDLLCSPHSLLFNTYQSYFTGVKKLGHEVNHSPPSRAKVKNEWSYTSTPLYIFMAWTKKNLTYIFKYK
jgi:hypothetical protein